MKSELDAYANALHIKRGFGKSLRQLMDIYEMIPEWGTDVKFNPDYAATITESDLDHQIYSLERLVAAGKAIGHPHKHPLSAVHQNKYSQRLKFDLNSIICEYKSVLEKVRDDTSEFVHLMNINMPVSGDE